MSTPPPFSRPLRKIARQTADAYQPPSAECQRLLRQLLERCPGLLPPDPLAAGTVGPEIPVSQPMLQRLLAEAATQGPAGEVVWTRGDSELLIVTSKVGVTLDRGMVIVSIPVICDQIGSAMVQVPFAVGDAEHPAGMIAATEERPRGPATIVDLWAEPLVAFAWNTLLTAMAAVADATGTDEDGAGLIPAALTATPDGIRILTMARHAFDRATR